MSETRAISKIIACTTAGTYNLYTCPSNCRAKIILVFITNAGAINDVSLKWYRKQANISFFIIGGKNLNLGEYIQFDGNAYIMLDPGDRLDVTTDHNGVIDALCTAEESFTANTTRAV
jgi:hypothetical protein